MIGWLLGLLAALIGTAIMTISSEIEATLSGRGPSDTPGKAASKLLQMLGGKPLEGKQLKVASTIMHWLYGTMWGLVFWLLVDYDLLSLDLWYVWLVFFIIVWGTAQVVQPALGVAKPSPAYGGKALATDIFHHLVFALATTLAWWLMIQAVIGDLDFD